MHNFFAYPFDSVHINQRRVHITTNFQRGGEMSCSCIVIQVGNVGWDAGEKWWWDGCWKRCEVKQVATRRKRLQSVIRKMKIPTIILLMNRKWPLWEERSTSMGELDKWALTDMTVKPEPDHFWFLFPPTKANRLLSPSDNFRESSKTISFLANSA